MRSMFAGASTAAALLSLAACQSPEPVKTAETAPPATVTLQVASAPVQVVSVPATVVLAPNPPPPAQVEFIPPRPDNAPSAVWQPGHWRWGAAGGAAWQWVAGTYVVPPPGHHAWIPGRWQLQPNGWMWSEGHWA
jgi:hypothetical protein